MEQTECDRQGHSNCMWWSGRGNSGPVFGSFRAQSVPLHEKVNKKGLPQPIVTTSLKCRGDWIRTSDLLNPIQAVLAGKIARTDGFSTYKSHTSHIIRSGTHIFHKTCRVSYLFLPFPIGPMAAPNRLAC